MSCDGGGQFCNRSFEPFLPGGEASVTFSFSVIGSKSETVPLIFTGFGDATMSTGSEASSAFAYVNTPGGDFTACFIAGIPPCYYQGLSSSFSFSTNYNASPNFLYNVSVSGLGHGGSDFFPGSTLAFDAGLKVEIDPNFVDASDFKIEFSSAPTRNVQEPSSLLMLGAGLLALLGLQSSEIRGRSEGVICDSSK